MNTITIFNHIVDIRVNDYYISTTKTYISYSVIIDSLIRSKYSASDIEAIVNNYLLDNTNEDYIKEFNAMQEWRKEAKHIANKVIDYIKNENLLEKPDGIYEIED